MFAHSIAAAGAVVGLPAFAAALALRPAWRPGWRERLGAVRGGSQGGFWVHAASLGETRAAEPLLEALLARDERVVLTHTRALARDTAAREAFAPRLAGHSLAPLDHRWAVDRALQRVAPRALVLSETELWPVTIRRATEFGCAVGVVSASISPASRRRYEWLGPLVRGTFERLAFVAARSQGDAETFCALGAQPERVAVTGDLKLAGGSTRAALPESIARGLGKEPLWVAGSTHPGEEEAVLDAVQHCRSRGMEFSAVIAPRRIERRDAVVAAIERAGLRARLRTRWGAQPLASDEVGVIDVTGELACWYGAATLAFVGGSLVPVGGHNLYEASREGALVLHGPHTASIVEAERALAERGGAERVGDARQLAEAVERWLAHPEGAQARAARSARWLREQGGSVERTLAWIDRALAARSPL